MANVYEMIEALYGNEISLKTNITPYWSMMPDGHYWSSGNAVLKITHFLGAIRVFAEGNRNPLFEIPAESISSIQHYNNEYRVQCGKEVYIFILNCK